MLGRAFYTVTQSSAILSDIENAERVLETCRMPHVLSQLKPYLLHYSDQFAEFAQLPRDMAMYANSLDNADLMDGGNFFARTGIYISPQLHAAVAEADQERRLKALGGMYACFLLASIFKLQRHLNKVSGFARERIRLTMRELRRTLSEAMTLS